MESEHRRGFNHFLRSNEYGRLQGLNVTLSYTSLVSFRLSITSKGFGRPADPSFTQDYAQEIVGGLLAYIRTASEKMNQRHLSHVRIALANKKFLRIQQIRQAMAPSLPWIAPAQAFLYPGRTHGFLLPIPPDEGDIKEVLGMLLPSRML